jgi:hypothetical protein
MRPDRFLGLFALGLIILGVAAVLWAVGVADTAVAVILVLGGLVALTGLWVLARPPVLATLDDGGVRVRGLRTEWSDITVVGKVETTQGKALAIRTNRADDTLLIPLRWMKPAQGAKLEAELGERLNAAHGYTEWDGTAGDDPDQQE